MIKFQAILKNGTRIDINVRKIMYEGAMLGYSADPVDDIMPMAHTPWLAAHRQADTLCVGGNDVVEVVSYGESSRVELEKIIEAYRNGKCDRCKNGKKKTT